MFSATVKKAFIFSLIGGFIAFLFLHRNSTHKKSHKKTIGIIQTASHPALDAACKGFVDGIQARVSDDIGYAIRNAQGSINTLHAIAQQFHAKDDITAIFAIATPAAQAAALAEDKKPLCIAAVSFSPDMKDIFSKKNICGTSDMINIKAEIAAMKALLPECASVAILYSLGEINAVISSELMAKELKKNNIMPIMIGITSEMDIEPSIIAVGNKVDAFLAPTDNVVANAVSLIVEITQRLHKPFIVSDNMLVAHGPLMACGVDYYQSGKLSADILLQVLVDGKNPSDLPIIAVDNKQIFINKKTCQAFGIIVPESIAADVVFV